MTSPSSVLIVGAGHAGLQAAGSLRDGGFTGDITLLGNEAHHPYQRPPLSKAGLELDSFSTPTIRPPRYFEERSIKVVLGDKATRLDRSRRRVLTSAGREFVADHIILATGASNRRLSIRGEGLRGVFYLRTVDEARALRGALHDAKRLVVIGAGFIGLEVAAIARKRAIVTTVIDIDNRPMARAVSPQMSGYILGLHTAAGAEVILNTSVEEIEGCDGTVQSVRLASGEKIAADVVLIGIGAAPNVDLALGASLQVDNGILADEYLTTSDSDISAIGDCASFLAQHGQRVRLESVQNATDQARSVAAKLLGRSQPYAAIPWFWSDQGDTKLQIVGLVSGCGEMLVSGNPGEHSFSVFCFREGKLAGIESVNRPADHMAGRRLLKLSSAIQIESVVAANFDMKVLEADVRARELEAMQ